MKKISVIITISLCFILFLTACGSTAVETTSTPTAEITSALPSENPTVSDNEENSSTDGNVVSDDVTETTQTTSTASTQTQGNSNNTQSTNSSPTNPPATSTPTTVTPPDPPTISTPTTPTKPTYTEADYKEIENVVRAYGEAKGFKWDDLFTFEQGHQYYGRPNIVDLSKESVISDLKYHCDKIERDVGFCNFKVVRHIYQSKLEFIVVYD